MAEEIRKENFSRTGKDADESNRPGQKRVEERKEVQRKAERFKAKKEKHS
jgi:hypothetical protein